MTTLPQRIEEIAKDQGLTITGLEKEIGASKGVLSRPLQKNTDIGSKWMVKIVENYPQYNGDWLLRGIGSKEKKYEIGDDRLALVSEDSPEMQRSPIQSRVPRRPPPGGLIKFYDTDFVAGDVDFYDDNSSISPAYSMDIPEFSGCTAFRTYNNSMEKLIYSGDILFATKEEDWQDSLEYGQIYGIVTLTGRRFLKYIRKDDKKPETHFLLRSENPDYDDFHVAKEKIKSIWLIHGWLKKRAG